MKLLDSFLRLVRFPNLVFIALTQVLFYFCILAPLQLHYPEARMAMGRMELWLLIAASICIAAGGYVINDYFDLNIDKVNRPDSLVIERSIKRRWAIVWHLALSITGLVLSFVVCRRIGNYLPGLFNALSVLLLWLYSTTFKKQLLIGNVIISLLTSWVVLVLYVCEAGIGFHRLEGGQLTFVKSVYKWAILYGGFAFMASLIREVVKDMEDMAGDARYGCRTMPIVWGLRSTKVFTAVWVIVLFFSVFAVAVYALMLSREMLALYLATAVMLPVASTGVKIHKAFTSADFAKLSRLLKIVMLTGILSMLFFLFRI
jgi:4-hydroxybenzoate polyprenyltransferase